ncbi:hypothetical protein JCM19235_4449 [Vibrio maritimus]|uniref:Uncharacterized protein n=1 Tax=Vibrio maritimus TaxID=990268 RepID=A0A090S165_9VIBR|nr:hypothetical protein JCM19235_4449 [Vibrio maritimus]
MDREHYSPSSPRMGLIVPHPLHEDNANIVNGLKNHIYGIDNAAWF